MGQGVGRASVEELAAASGPDAWRLAVVAGVDPAAATRAALHALVVGAVDGGAAAERAGILALSRSWALASASSGPVARSGEEPAASAFWSLSEPLRSTLWCADVLRLPAEDIERVLGRAGGRAPGAARGRLRRTACRQRLDQVAPGSACAAVAAVLGPVLAGHAAGTKLARVDGHAVDCEECARLVGALRDPAAAVAASLPPAPDLVTLSARAWRTHVGEPKSTLPDQVRRAASAVSRHRRPVVAALVLATAGTFGSATSQLAASSERSAPQAPVAAPANPPAAPRPGPAPVVRRQAVIPPLAAEAVVDPVLRRWVTPELAEVTPVTTPPPPPTTASPAPVSDPARFGEPPPAQDLSTNVDLSLPLPISLPLSIEVGPACSTLTIGPLRLTLPCKQ